jgi:uncharacterized membrane protein
MATTKSATYTSRSKRSKLFKILRILLIIFVAAVVLIFLMKQAQIHLTDGGQGSSEGGSVDSSSMISR